MKNAKFKAWVHALRLRTLPLSIAGVLMGSILAYYHAVFEPTVFILAMITTLLLQILSNLANDYGDFKHGVDNENRVGPTRAVQSGIISANEMRKALILFSVLTFMAGIILLIMALHGLGLKFLVFLGLGLTAILAALKYTIGASNYGYRGLGDVTVFIFFGLVAVIGTYFLHVHQLEIWILFPAIMVGLLSAGVLNINNMRDVANDAQTGKMTLAVKLGTKSKIYHAALVSFAILAMLIHLIHFKEWLTIFICIIPISLLIKHIVVVIKNNDPKLLDPELKQLSLTTLLFVSLVGIGFML